MERFSEKEENFGNAKRLHNMKRIYYTLLCVYLEIQQVLVQVNMTNLPRKQFSNADFPALLGPKTKHWKIFLSHCCFLRSKRLLLVTRMAEDGSPGNPMYIKCSTLRAGSNSVINDHCKDKIERLAQI